MTEEQNSKTPVKLRQAIKGSIAAITYYLLSILHLVFEELHLKIDAFDPVGETSNGRARGRTGPKEPSRRRGKQAADP